MLSSFFFVAEAGDSTNYYFKSNLEYRRVGSKLVVFEEKSSRRAKELLVAFVRCIPAPTLVFLFLAA